MAPTSIVVPESGRITTPLTEIERNTAWSAVAASVRDAVAMSSASGRSTPSMPIRPVSKGTVIVPPSGDENATPSMTAAPIRPALTSVSDTPFRVRWSPVARLSTCADPSSTCGAEISAAVSLASRSASVVGSAGSSSAASPCDVMSVPRASMCGTRIFVSPNVKVRLSAETAAGRAKAAATRLGTGALALGSVSRPAVIRHPGPSTVASSMSIRAVPSRERTRAT